MGRGTAGNAEDTAVALGWQEMDVLGCLLKSNEKSLQGLALLSLAAAEWAGEAFLSQLSGSLLGRTVS